MAIEHPPAPVGSFEIFVASQNDSTEKAKTGRVFSKLALGKWPIEGEVINSIVKYTGTVTLAVSLDLPYFDLADLPQDLLNHPEENKLLGVEVLLTPYRQNNSDGQQQQQQQQPQMNTSVNESTNPPTAGSLLSFVGSLPHKATAEWTAGFEEINRNALGSQCIRLFLRKQTLR